MERSEFLSTIENLKKRFDKPKDPMQRHNAIIELVETQIKLENAEKRIVQLESETTSNKQQLQEVRIQNEKLSLENNNLKQEESPAYKQELDNLKTAKDQKIQVLMEQIIQLTLGLEEKNKLIKELENDYKTHIIKVHLKGLEKLSAKDLTSIKELYELNQDLDKTQDKAEEEPQQEEQEEEVDQEVLYNPIDPESEDYIKSETCLCGKPKYYGAKGCLDCKRQADRLRSRFDVGMEEAWKEVWKTYGESLEK